MISAEALAKMAARRQELRRAALAAMDDLLKLQEQRSGRMPDAASLSALRDALALAQAEQDAAVQAYNTYDAQWVKAACAFGLPTTPWPI